MKYSLEKGGPKKLELSWKGKFEELTVYLDGHKIGKFTDQEHQQVGQEFILPDGSCLKIQRTGTGIFSFPQIYLNGHLLPTAGPGPRQRLKMSYQVVFIIAGINIFAGLYWILLKESIGNLPIGGWRSMVAGLLFGILGIFILRKSIIALSIATGLFFLDSIAFFVHPHDIPRFYLIILIVFRAAVLLVMIQGFSAIPALKNNSDM